jgi:NAD(P)-dependent dehydrogenase (short-subunit alcohol dehydrogenase family)
MTRLEGHVALVTGGNTGIGLAISQRLAVEGARMAVGYVESVGVASTLVEEIADDGGVAVAVRCDVTDEGSVRDALEEVAARIGPITTLVNNAGVLTRQPFSSLDEPEWDAVMQASLYGAYRCSRLAIPAMLQAERGTIVNITSELVSLGGVNLAHYVAAKSGVVGLTRSLARELGPQGIRVNAVAPGPTETRMVEVGSVTPGFVETIPLRRIGQPGDVAGAVAFLCSDDAAWVTGQVLGVNGGLVMS